MTRPFCSPREFMPPLILHLIPTLAPYGAERIVVELAARLPEHGFRTRVAVLFDGDGGPLWREVRARDIRWSLVGNRTSSRIGMVHALRQMLRDEEDRRPALIHTHLFGGDFWGECARIGMSGMPPRISTAHNVDRDDSTLRRAARAWSMRRADTVVAISEEVERYMQQELGVRKDRIRVIPNGTDLSRLQERADRPFHTPAHLLMVGRLEPQKGHDTVLQALASVSAPWRLSIAGTGSLERTLKERVERLGLMSRVHFLGARHDVPALLADADLLLFPSKWEGMGLVPLEAIASGVPVIASDLPAMRDLLPQSALVAPENVPAWTRAIAEALADAGPHLARARRLAPTVRKRYDIETMVACYAALYQELLSA